MARITIEDCIEKVPNRFHLVQMAAIRAKQLKRGAHALVQADENKDIVVALREVAAGLVLPDDEAAATMESVTDGSAQQAASEAPVEAPAAPPTETPPAE